MLSYSRFRVARCCCSKGSLLPASAPGICRRHSASSWPATPAGASCLLTLPPCRSGPFETRVSPKGCAQDALDDVGLLILSSSPPSSPPTLCPPPNRPVVRLPSTATPRPRAHSIPDLHNDQLARVLAADARQRKSCFRTHCPFQAAPAPGRCLPRARAACLINRPFSRDSSPPPIHHSSPWHNHSLTRANHSRQATAPPPACPPTAPHPPSRPQLRPRICPPPRQPRATQSPRTSRHGTPALSASKTSASSNSDTCSPARRPTT